MEWQAVVLVMQILMLAIGWFLFQQARAELSAHAAQTPVLSEVRALQRSIRQLLEEITQTSDRASNQLERRCDEAEDLLAALDRRLDQLSDLTRQGFQQAPFEDAVPVRIATMQQQHPVYRRDSNDSGREYATIAKSGSIATTSSASPGGSVGRQQIYTLADRGEAPGEIAQMTGLSEGEIETLLALRGRRGK